jgi:hypothetical protein
MRRFSVSPPNICDSNTGSEGSGVSESRGSVGLLAGGRQRTCWLRHWNAVGVGKVWNLDWVALLWRPASLLLCVLRADFGWLRSFCVDVEFRYKPLVRTDRACPVSF